MPAPRVVTFGEVMLRLSPPGAQRLVQARALDVVFGGGEANVAVSLASLGVPVQFVTRLPPGPLGEACRNAIRQFGVGLDRVVWGGDRLGIYFLEAGAAQRPSRVIYDRAGSAMATLRPGMIDWDAVFADATWFHVTGITPALSEGAAAACIEAVTAAASAGVTVSCDLNYRRKLWKWGRPAAEVMPELVARCDVAIGNEEDAAQSLGIHAEGVDVTAGDLDSAPYRRVCEQMHERFPGLSTIAITLRSSVSASHNRWSAVLWQRGGFRVGPRYDIAPIVDRVGAGDAFAAALVYALATERDDALPFAVAASCLKHTIPGDFNPVSVAEVEALMRDGSGRISR